MHGIYLTAVLTSAAAAAIFAPIIHKLPQPADERLLWLAFLVALPLQPLAFYEVRLPVDHWLVGHLGSKSGIYQWLISLYAPLTEEPAKLVPLLIPAIFRDIGVKSFARYGLAIGVGFAVGEMWFVADRVAHQPAYAGMPFYLFTGYAVERLMTCVFHTAFVSVTLWQLRRRVALGFAGAAAMHWLANFPILLMNWNTGRLGKPVWMAIVNGWLVIYFLAAVGLLTWFLLGKFSPTLAIFGRRVCPECGGEYHPPIFAVNFGRTRYERCPHCRKWHWTGRAAPEHPTSNTQHPTSNRAGPSAPSGT